MNDPKDKTRLVFDLGETAQCLFLAHKLQYFTTFCAAKKRSERERERESKRGEWLNRQQLSQEWHSRQHFLQTSFGDAAHIHCVGGAEEEMGIVGTVEGALK